MGRPQAAEQRRPANVVLVDGSNVAHATEGDAPLVGNLSNDWFRDRAKQFPEARERVIRFMIVNDEVVLERRTHRRHED